MKKAIVLFAVIGIALAGAARAEEKAAAGKPQTNCPMMGGKIDRSIYADYDGKRVYFCCDACPAEFKKDPAKYIKSMEDAGIVLEKPQATCPVMGNKINTSIFVEHEGYRIYFCCPACIEKFKKEPAKYMKTFDEQGVTLEKVQTTCPVTGDKIDKKVFADHDGKRIYLCCADCIEKLKKDPATYIKKLIDAGVTPESAPAAGTTGHSAHGGHMGH